MTLHSAKGLEFPVVYIIGLEDGLLPFRREGDDLQDDEEEERRLCFVGMTRAKRDLTLSYCLYRMMRGSAERKVRSAFLGELPAQEIEWLDLCGDSGADPANRKPCGQLPADIELWEPGTLVQDKKRGLGRVLWIHPHGEDTRAGIRFEDGTERTYIVRFSGLVRVDPYEAGLD
jgi:hypothetical protein